MHRVKVIRRAADVVGQKRKKVASVSLNAGEVPHSFHFIDDLNEIARPLFPVIQQKMSDPSQDVQKVMRKTVADLT